MLKVIGLAGLLIGIGVCHDRDTIILTHKKFDINADQKVTRKEMRQGIMDDLNGK